MSDKSSRFLVALSSLRDYPGADLTVSSPGYLWRSISTRGKLQLCTLYVFLIDVMIAYLICVKSWIGGVFGYRQELPKLREEDASINPS